MEKKEARNIAIDYLFKAAYAFTDINAKYVIDDRGTLSENGYSYEDCEVIQKELDFLIKHIMKFEKSQPPNLI